MHNLCTLDKRLSREAITAKTQRKIDTINNVAKKHSLNLFL